MQKVEINIPDGTKVDNVDILDGIAVVHYSEKKEEFKRGDVLYIKSKYKWLAIVDEINDAVNYMSSLDLGIGNLDYPPFNNRNGICRTDETEVIRLSTPSEAQELFDALAKKGKYWDAETLEVKDLVRVPESIGIYTLNDGIMNINDWGDRLFIGFGSNQILGYDSVNNNYTVFSADGYEKVRCYLQPIKREDLKEGDTAICRGFDDGGYYDICDYCKIIDDEYQAAISESKNIVVNNWDGYHCHWYKLIPIND